MRRWAAFGGLGRHGVQVWNAEVFCLLFSKKVRPAAGDTMLGKETLIKTLLAVL